MVEYGGQDEKAGGARTITKLNFVGKSDGTAVPLGKWLLSVLVYHIHPISRKCMDRFRLVSKLFEENGDL